jgi:glycosyltransferase involved in cell wall biosynthesis
MRVGYLQIGAPQHGICRYGRALAAEARRRADVTVLEENLEPTGDLREDRPRLQSLAKRMSDMDVVHLQVTPWGEGSWGGGRSALANLASFRRACRAPLVITLHDVNGLAGLDCGRPLHLTRGVSRELLRGLRPLAGRLVRQTLRGRLDPSQLSAVWNWSPLYACAVARAAARAGSVLLVLTGPEKSLLASTGIAPGAVLIPLFVENSPESLPARSSTPQGATKTLILAGFIFHSKGHELVLEAMQLLPDVRVVFAGGKSLAGFGSSHYSQLMDFARERGVIDRLEVTGYLPDAEYRQRLGSADLAICPFDANKSASASLSALIAAGCPVLASDIPVIAEYNALVPGSIPTFSPRTPEALAAAVRRILATPRAELTRGLAELRRRLSIATIFDLHLDVYRRVLAS